MKAPGAGLMGLSMKKKNQIFVGAILAGIFLIASNSSSPPRGVNPIIALYGKTEVGSLIGASGPKGKWIDRKKAVALIQGGEKYNFYSLTRHLGNSESMGSGLNIKLYGKSSERTVAG